MFKKYAPGILFGVNRDRKTLTMSEKILFKILQDFSLKNQYDNLNFHQVSALRDILIQNKCTDKSTLSSDIYLRELYIVFKNKKDLIQQSENQQIYELLFSDLSFLRLKTQVLNNLQENKYLNDSRDNFIKLLELVLVSPLGYMTYLRHSMKYLNEWIISKLPTKLTLDKEITTSTKVYWILLGLDSQPICKHCNKPIQRKNIKSLNHSCMDFCSYSCSSKFLYEQSSNKKIELYGDTWNYNKCLESYRKNFGCDNPSQNLDIFKKQRTKYLYDGCIFDSSFEIAFYIHLKKNNKNFVYQPDISFQYFFNGKKYKYFPDFIVDGKVIEIKGEHFFKDKDPNKEMICPFRKRTWSDSDYLIQCEKYEAKHQCMLDNNVEILTSKDILPYFVDIIEEKGQNFFNSLKQSKN